jgi:hypothetical protein
MTEVNAHLPPGVCHLCAIETCALDLNGQPAPLVRVTLESLDGKVLMWRVCPRCHLAFVNTIRRCQSHLQVHRP